MRTPEVEGGSAGAPPPGMLHCGHPDTPAVDKEGKHVEGGNVVELPDNGGRTIVSICKACTWLPVDGDGGAAGAAGDDFAAPVSSR